MKNTSFFFLVLAMAAAVLIAGCAQERPAPPSTPQPTPEPTSIKTAGTIGTAGSPYGTILVDSLGRTLYYSANDIPGSGVSTCTGECAALWPAISADTAKMTAPLIPADFGSITRTDGSGQTTYRGRPLYYSRSDSHQGDFNGENAQNAWFVVRPGEHILAGHKADLGVYLTDSSGKTLYYNTNDTAGMSTCTGSCLTLWPAFSADPVTVPPFLNTTDFSTVSRADGIKQTAFMKRPLYSFAGDGNPGEVNGQGASGIWYVANVSVAALK
jgi:predicted lipoprotein with Yx(FWY)xxD motif